MGRDKDTLIGQKRKRIVITTVRKDFEYTKQLMPTAVAHHSQTSALPAPERALASSPQFMCWAQWDVWNTLWPGWVSYPSCGHFWPLVPPLLKAEKSLAQCKHCSAPTQTAVCYQHHSLPKSKTFTGAATRRKINSIPARSSTVLQFGQLPTETGFAAVGDYNIWAEIAKCLKDCDFIKKGCNHSWQISLTNLCSAWIQVLHTEFSDAHWSSSPAAATIAILTSAFQTLRIMRYFPPR